MLTASASTPNTLQKKAKSAPTPDNWYGVAGGMDAAKKAITCGALEQAEQILTEMLEFAPAETPAWKLLARVQRKLGRVEAGIKSATRALQLQIPRPQPQAPASVTLAQLLWKQGEKELAMEMLSLLITRQPEDQSLVVLKSNWDKESDS
ncbi:Tetratricopeptide repeat-containing protein [Mariprofundus aestuarium]|uniref:Tetratricopeptide repeat-containing protein n=1 Tax=Mariprofundus aestuarium TaxID=1921086 RepID=A0A2K8L4C2_MARES|nr:hypothetical protein [Mariprofundus aestuarium]ATX79824.1 Tetratricopeptide repeat-containing protein [Mariprofundus aestuarium]